MTFHRSGPIGGAAVLAATALVVMGLSACTTSGGGDPASTTVADANLEAIVRVAAPLEPTTLDPIKSLGRQTRVTEQLFDALVGRDAEGAPDDTGLLTSWERVDDTTWEFTLRQEVTFHDGSDFTAEDVVYTMEQGKIEPAAPYGSFYKRVVSAEAIDDATVVMKTAAPDNSLPAVLTVVYPVPSDYYAEVGTAGFEQNPIGTGPFVFDSRQPGQSLSLARFDDYWGDVAKVAGVRFTFSADAAGRASLLQSGDVDIVYDLPQQSLAELEASDSVHIESAPVASLVNMLVRAQEAPLDDAELREAVSLAVDREALIELIYGENAIPVNKYATFILPDVPDQDIPYDLKRAQEIVSEHGGSPEIGLTYSTGAFPQDKAMGEAIAAMLTEAGFTVRQEILEVSKIIQRMREGGAGMNVWILQSDTTIPHPEVVVSFYLAEGAIPNFCVDQKEYSALSARGREARDEESMQAAYEDLDKKVLTEDHCYVPLAQTVASYGVANTVRDFAVPLTGSPDFAAVSMSK
ncbi:MAG: ABC transporter substrate-binding protein [Microbacterium sp.]